MSFSDSTPKPNTNEMLQSLDEAALRCVMAVLIMIEREQMDAVKAFTDALESV